MIDQSVAKRYAQGLFGAARSEGVADRLLADLETLEALVAQDRSLVRFLESPQQLESSKIALVEKLFRGKASDLFVRFLVLLVRKGRVPHLIDTMRVYRILVEESHGVTEARVTTAVPLPNDLRARLQSELERLFRKTVRIRPRLDPRIIGGIFVMIEGKIIDRSIRTELTKLRDVLLGANVRG